MTVRALWASVPAEDPVLDATGSEALIPVVLDGGFAYLTPEGSIAYRGRTAYGVALCDAAFVNHSRTPSQLVLQHPDGAYRSTVPVAGYPVFAGGRLLVIADAGGAVSEWTLEGDRIWRMELPAPLLSLDASSDHLVLGPLAGGPIVIDQSGARVDLGSPGAQKHPVVYRVALGGTPDRLAILSGTAPAADDRTPDTDTGGLVLSLYDLASGRADLLARRAISGAANADALVALFSDHRLLYGRDYPDPVVVGLEPDGSLEYELSLPYPARAAVELSGLPLYAVLSSGALPDPARGFLPPASLVVADRAGRVAASARWAAASVTIAHHEWIDHAGLMTIRLDDRVLAVRMEVR